MGTSVYDLMQPLAPSGLCVNNEFANKLLNSDFMLVPLYLQNKFYKLMYLYISLTYSNLLLKSNKT